MGRNKQDSSRNFRSWNKIISVLRARVIFVFFLKKKVVIAHLKNCKITPFFLSSVAKHLLLHSILFFCQNLKRFDSHYFQLPYEDVLLVSQVVK